MAQLYHNLFGSDMNFISNTKKLPAMYSITGSSIYDKANQH